MNEKRESPMKFMTTLNDIRAHSPCSDGWGKLLNTLGKTKADDEPLSLLTILESNGIDDALWCAIAFKNHDRDFRLFAVWAARQVQDLMTDPRSLNALDVSEQFANGLCDEVALAAAWSAARDAAWSAAWSAAGGAAWSAARDAAGGAARDAAWSSAWSSARSAAWSAARSAAWSSAWSSARSAARSAARDAQEKRLRQMVEDGEWVGSTERLEGEHL